MDDKNPVQAGTGQFANIPYPDLGDTQGYQGILTEENAMILAFHSLIDPDSSNRIAYAQAARNMLMYAFNLAAPGHVAAAPGQPSIPFRDPAELVKQANNSVYGLAAGIWTRDIQKAHRLAAQLRAGTVWINCYNIFDAALPFGGYKQSGWGREMGHEVLEQYTEVKAVCAAL